MLTWNLFHGRSVPGAGRELLAEFTDLLRAWAWDVALLQEVPPWWTDELARATRAGTLRSLTSRNGGLPLRRIVGRRWPDLIKSNAGGSNVILSRLGVNARRVHRLRYWPERRLVQAVALDAGIWVANLHASTRSDRAAADVIAAADRVGGWAGGAPVILGGDLNLTRSELPVAGPSGRSPNGLTPLASSHVDHVLAHGMSLATPLQRPDHGALSDHRPLIATLRRTDRGGIRRR